jgi:hypothetical protein
LHQGIQIAGGTLVLEPNIPRLLLGIVVGEVVPQNTRLILDEAKIGGDVGSVIFAEGSAAALPWYIKHSAVLDKSSKTPIAFFLSESMMGSVMDI